MKFLKVILMLGFIFSLGCSSKKINSHGVETISQAEYDAKVLANTQQIEKYEGIMNVLHFSATLLNTQMKTAVALQKARLYQWDSALLNSEMQKVNTELDQTTEIFVSLYTPERKLDDLHKNKTLWKIFLDADGRRWEGKATKIKLLTNEIQAIYPEHTRFATPYLLSFPVSTRLIEGKPVRLTLTGTVTSATVEFAPQ